MSNELQDAWREYCDSVSSSRVDLTSFKAGWTACERLGGRSIDELAFIGRQMAQGVSPDEATAGLDDLRKPAA